MMPELEIHYKIFDTSYGYMIGVNLLTEDKATADFLYQKNLYVNTRYRGDQICNFDLLMHHAKWTPKRFVELFEDIPEGLIPEEHEESFKYSHTFEKFVEFMVREGRISELIDKIHPIIEGAIQGFFEKFYTRSYKIRLDILPESSRTTRVSAPLLRKKTFLKVGNTVYEVKLFKVKDVEDFEDIVANQVEKIEAEYQARIETIMSQFEQEREELLERIRDVKAEAMRNMLRQLFALLRNGWEVSKEGLIYPHKIVATRIAMSERGKIVYYRIPEKHRKFFIDGLIYRPNGKLRALRAHYHPHVSRTGNVCTGDVFIYEIKDLMQIPLVLSTIYVNSVFTDTGAYNYLKDILEEICVPENKVDYQLTLESDDYD